MGRTLAKKTASPAGKNVLLWLLLILPFLFGALNELLGLPRALRYILDVAWVLLLVLMWRSRGEISKGKPTGRLLVWVLLFVCYTSFVYLAKYRSALYYLWGARNNFRFYAAFFAFAFFFTEADAETCLKIFDGIFWLNVGVSLVQYFGMGLSGDYLGGIFGVNKGVNGYTNIFLVIVVTRTVVLFLEKKESLWLCAAKGLAALLVAVLSELKFFFIEAVMIVALAVVFTGFTRRKLWIIAGSVCAVFVGALMVSHLFPDFKNWFSLEAMLESALSDRGYTSAGDMNRLNAIPRINKLWLTDGGQQLFGLGLGNCETSSFAFLNTPFFQEHGEMHYSWFSHAHMYLECGWVGLIFYFGFFILVFFRAGKVRKNGVGMLYIYSTMAMILSAVCIGIAIYNSSLRTEAGYMMYFALALPFIQHAGRAGPQKGKQI